MDNDAILPYRGLRDILLQYVCNNHDAFPDGSDHILIIQFTTFNDKIQKDRYCIYP